MSINQKPPSKKKPFEQYARYSSIAFQLVAIVLIGVFIGHKLDQYFSQEPPIFTLIFSLIFVVFAILLVVRQVMKN